MKIYVYPSNERGRGDHDWLKSRFSFSFADWYDETKMGFGTLRVLNDDVIAAGKGFGFHGHTNMEIITIVTSGSVKHSDSLGNQYVVKRGDVQVMSVGTGVYHSEENNSEVEDLKLFQIWIEPKELDLIPRYDQKTFNYEEVQNSLAPLVNGGGLVIHQDVYILYGSLNANKFLDYNIAGKENGVYIFVVEGSLLVGGTLLGKRDAVGITDTGTITITATSDASFLIIEVPMNK